jgi:hypothetical protein
VATNLFGAKIRDETLFSLTDCSLLFSTFEVRKGTENKGQSRERGQQIHGSSTF